MWSHARLHVFRALAIKTKHKKEKSSHVLTDRETLFLCLWHLFHLESVKSVKTLEERNFFGIASIIWNKWTPSPALTRTCTHTPHVQKHAWKSSMQLARYLAIMTCHQEQEEQLVIMSLLKYIYLLISLLRHSSCATTGIFYYFILFFKFCNFALFHLHTFRYSLQLTHRPLPKDLFMKAESLNPSSLYSSEAVRWQLIMSVLMILQPGKQSKHFGTASSLRPRWLRYWILISEKLGGVNVWRLQWKKGVVLSES